MSSTVKVTNYPAIKNAPLIGIVEGNGSFSNLTLAALVLGVPYFLKKWLPLIRYGGSTTYWVLVVLFGLPITIGYWTFMGTYGKRVNEKVALPGKDIEEYITLKDMELKIHYGGKEKIPMQVFHDAYFDGKVEFKGDVLEIMEQRHDWATFHLTPELFKYVFTRLIPDVIFHTQSQDEEQVREHYDRGDDFYGWFLGPRMIYTSGVVMDINRKETLEELQDNKLNLVCNKLDLKPEDRFLDIGCGWGTLATFAAKNFGCDATGVTLSKHQTTFGNQRLKDNGVTPDKGRILCMDYREIPGGPGTFTKISALEMAEHVGIRRYGTFLKQIYNLLDDQGVFFLQVAGIRQCWQFEDLVWGLFMNKYIFPGADASCSLSWVVNQCEKAGFEIKCVDVLGVHYSATIFRWYENWVSNKDKVIAAYGERWYRIWVFFLAYSTIISRQGSFSVFQLTLVKNLNATHRIAGQPSHTSLHGIQKRDILPVD